KKASPHERAFLDDVVAHPEDDGPRLVFADWLDDHAQPHRAEFIRLQCRLASMDEYDPERLPLEQREADLLAVRGAGGPPPVPTWAQVNPYAFRRGFLDRISVTATDLLKRGAGLFAVAPVTDLQICNVRDKMPQVAASPLLGRLIALDFDDRDLSAADLRA